MASTDSARSFSEQRHCEGKWNTRMAAVNWPARVFWNFISFKRSGISRLAGSCRPGSAGIEIGSGTGAYAHWFAQQCRCTVVATDWSFQALSLMPADKRHRILRVCADAQMLPFRARTFDFVFTVDVLGHIENPNQALDEVLRVTRPACPVFIHSECSDYRRRWPDIALIKKLGIDFGVQLDGHWSLRNSAQIYQMLIARFHVTSFFSPAGLAGWLCGYPEKYSPAFAAASWRFLAAATSAFAVIKRTPVAGAFLRLINALSNHIELFFGIVGGGSCFADGPTPIEPDQEQTRDLKK
jgi:SAM-dependent methyltransferase